MVFQDAGWVNSVYAIIKTAEKGLKFIQIWGFNQKQVCKEGALLSDADVMQCPPLPPQKKKFAVRVVG